MTESHQRWFHNLFQLQKLLGWQIIDKALSLELGPGKRGFMSVVMSYGVMVLGCAEQTPCSCVQCKYQRDIKWHNRIIGFFQVYITDPFIKNSDI